MPATPPLVPRPARHDDVDFPEKGERPLMPWTVRLTRAQAHRLVETYHYQGPREPAIQRLTTALLYVFDTPRRDRVELDTDPSGEPISWVAHAQINRLIHR